MNNRIEIVNLMLSLLMSLSFFSQISPSACQDDWNGYLNNSIERQSILYTDDTYVLTTNFNVLHGRNEIDSFYNNRNQILESSHSIFNTLANANRNIYYNIYKSKDSYGKEFKFLVISQVTDENCSILLEFGARITPIDKTEIVEIESRRIEWIKICNQHNARKLVQNLYSEQPIYYNHKPIITDKEELITDYSYMNNPSYELDLQPIVVEAINDHIVVEIGQCSGSYNGKYILIWQKDYAGVWKIKFDSNI